jgi:hypothetical protein
MPQSPLPPSQRPRIWPQRWDFYSDQQNVFYPEVLGLELDLSSSSALQPLPVTIYIICHSHRSSEPVQGKHQFFSLPPLVQNMTLHLKFCSSTSPLSKISRTKGPWGNPDFLLQCFFKNSSSRGDKEAEVAKQRS